MTQVELIGAIATKTGYSKKDITAVVKAFESVITDTVGEGEDIKVFPGFSIKTTIKDAHTARNPKTGETFDVPAKRNVKGVFTNTFKKKFTV